MTDTGRGRVDEITRTARRVLETEGPAALTMRRVADDLGIRAPSLYKHVADKRALEAAVVAEGLAESGDALRAAVDAEPDRPLRAVARAYRRFALDHPHLYRLMTEQPLPRDLLPAGLEDAAAAPVLAAAGTRARARVAWAFAHGLVTLELNDRFPADADVDAVWREGVRSLELAWRD